MLESELGTLDIPHHAALGMHESPALPLPYRHVSCGSLYSACGCGRIKRRQLRLFALSTPPLAFQLFCSPHSPPPPALHHCTTAPLHPLELAWVLFQRPVSCPPFDSDFYFFFLFYSHPLALSPYRQPSTKNFTTYHALHIDEENFA